MTKHDNDEIKSEVNNRKRRGRSLMIAFLLLAMGLLFYFITLAKGPVVFENDMSMRTNNPVINQ